jgi:hypothetical protein
MTSFGDPKPRKQLGEAIDAADLCGVRNRFACTSLADQFVKGGARQNTSPCAFLRGQLDPSRSGRMLVP